MSVVGGARRRAAGYESDDSDDDRVLDEIDNAGFPQSSTAPSSAAARRPLFTSTSSSAGATTASAFSRRPAHGSADASVSTSASEPLERLRRMGAEDLVLDWRMRVRAHQPMLRPAEMLAIFVGMPLIVFVVLLVTWGIDQGALPNTPHVASLATALYSLLHTEAVQVTVLVMSYAITSVGVLSLIITATAIILQLSALRFTPHVINLFVRTPFFVAMLLLQVLAIVLCSLVGYVASSKYSPGITTGLSTIVFTFSVLFIFPHFIYLFRFLKPANIVSRIMRDGLVAMMAASTRGGRAGRFAPSVASLQRDTLQTVDVLGDLLSTAVAQQNVYLATVIIDTLQYFLVTYGANKDAMRDGWYRVPSWARNTPNFLSLSPEALGDMEARGEFLEWKILQKLLAFYVTVVHDDIPELGYAVVNTVRSVALAAAVRRDWNVVMLCVRFFNTFIHTGLEYAHARFASTTLSQYRQVLDDLARLPDAESHEIAVQMCRYLRFYSVACLESELPVIAELIAHDVSTACQRAFRTAPPQVHKQLLDVLLTLDDMAEQGNDVATLRGVRRAQIRLAIYYLYCGREDLARLIYNDMKEEPTSRMQIIWQELVEQDSPEHFEIDDRGTSVDYVPPKHRAYIDVFFSWFPDLTPPSRVYSELDLPALVAAAAAKDKDREAGSAGAPGNKENASVTAPALGRVISTAGGTTAKLAAAPTPSALARRASSASILGLATASPVGQRGGLSVHMASRSSLFRSSSFLGDGAAAPAHPFGARSPTAHGAPPPPQPQPQPQPPVVGGTSSSGPRPPLAARASQASNQ